MRRTAATIKEWVNPDWVRPRTVPPMDAGLHPNRDLDDAEVLVPEGAFEPDDVVLTGSGGVLFSSGTTVVELRGERARTVADLDGAVGPLVSSGTGLVAAVDGVGLVSVSSSGSVEELCTERAVPSCVTDLAVLPDGSILVAVGSREEGASGWARALVHDDRSGQLVRVDGAQARVEATGLGWPAGIDVAADGDVLVSVSLDHRIERRALTALSRAGRPLLANLPGYPGRLTATDTGWWVAAPYVRNRVTELLLDEPAALAEMTSTIAQDEWFVPRLRRTNPYTDTMQMGQLRVHGVLKPWAPARSYGLAFRLDRPGRIAESAHSRVDGERHGVTGVAAAGGQLVVAARGYRNLLRLRGRKG